MTTPIHMSLEEIVTAVYCALDDALAHVGAECRQGKLVARRGPPPEVDDREVLCLAVLQELLGIESDHRFHEWLQTNPVIGTLFPRRLSRQQFIERRALLGPLLAPLCRELCTPDGEEPPPFSPSTRTPWTSAARFGPTTATSGSTNWRKPGAAMPLGDGFMACAST